MSHCLILVARKLVSFSTDVVTRQTIDETERDEVIVHVKMLYTVLWQGFTQPEHRLFRKPPRGSACVTIDWETRDQMTQQTLQYAMVLLKT